MERPTDCFFCQAAQQEAGSDSLVLLQAERNFVLLNSFPYNPGHLMVAPLRHTGDLTSLDDAELHEHFVLVRRMVSVIEKSLQAQGLNVGINLGAVGGAGVPNHLHTHIVPRWTGDTNFMPVIGSTKVLPQALKETYLMLKKGLGSA
ncbi:MAG: HIT domain-containing protein [Dehalococcoidia bacterium]|jgi:ATP adenylyltransferase|nr:HIT domain-containing protein [Dehalococcoidia bacterium]